MMKINYDNIDRHMKTSEQYDEGWRHFYKEGSDHNDNPYEIKTPEYNDWDAGFLDAYNYENFLSGYDGAAQ